MSVFADEERDYLVSGVRLGRLATVGPDVMPHVVPTAFRYNQQYDTIDIGGHDSPSARSTMTSSGTPRSRSSSTISPRSAPGVSGASRYEARRRSWTPAAPNSGGALIQRCSGSRLSAS